MLPLNLIIPAVCLALGLAGGWCINGWRYDAKLAAKDRAIAVANAKAQQGINEVHTVFVTVKEREKNAAATIKKGIDREIPASLPMLPPAWRVLHDHAATGEPFDSAQRNDGAPVAPKDASHTVADNYAECRYEKGRVAYWQGVARKLGVKVEGEE